MKSIDRWISETDALKAQLLIIFGEIEDSVLKECSSKFPKGILLVSDSPSQGDSGVLFKSVSPKTSLIDFSKVLSEFLLLDPINRPEVKISSLIKDDEFKIYEKLAAQTLNQIDTSQRARRTRLETGFTRQLQVFSNLPGYLADRVSENLKGVAKNNLAVVVGAGPSLDETLTLLKDGFPKPIIIATDSSLRALNDSNIIPDFIVSIDPEKTFGSCCNSEFSPGTLVLSSQAHPSWKEKWGENTIYISGRVLFEDWLSEKGVAKTPLQAINNAGLTALALADFLDPSVILLLGMDMSGIDDGSTRYAKITGRRHIQTLSSIYHDIPGNFSETVKTPFFSDWQETSDFCQKISTKRTIINLNNGGALLAGTNPIHPRESNELKELLSQNLDDFNNPPLFYTKFKKHLNDAGKIQILTLLSKKCDEVWRKLNEKNNDYKTILTDILKDQDLSSMLGDFSFSIMPSILADQDNLCYESLIQQLKSIIWKLEDAILESSPSESFTSKFLTQKFI